MTVDSFAQSEARVTIGYVGELERLVAMERVGLALAQESNGWRLRPAGGLAALPGAVAVSPLRLECARREHRQSADPGALGLRGADRPAGAR